MKVSAAVIRKDVILCITEHSGYHCPSNRFAKKVRIIKTIPRFSFLWPPVLGLEKVSDSCAICCICALEPFRNILI